MEALVFLTNLAIVMAIGLVLTVLSQKLKLSNVLLLIVAGIILAKISYKGTAVIEFSPAFLTSIGILALVMIIFDSSSKFKLSEFDKLSFSSLKLTFLFLLLNLIILTLALIMVLGLPINFYTVLIALLFSSLMSGTDPATVLSMMGNVKNKTIRLLEIESLINTPIIVVLPFIILDLISKLKTEGIGFSQLFSQAFPFFQSILLRLVAGIGAGVLIGIIILKIMRKKYSEFLSPLTIVTAALVTYILAENLGGNGVLAVTTIGLLFGNFYIEHKLQIRTFSSIFANSLEMLVFILIGFIINVPLNTDFFVRSGILFVIYIFIRLMAVNIAFRKSEYTFKEKVYMTLNVQKGIAVATVAFALTILNLEHLPAILNMVLIFMLYSIILSTIILKFSKYFLTPEKEKKALKND